MEFHLTKSDNYTNARAAKLITDHGVIETPIFMPVGTIGSQKESIKENYKMILMQK